MKFYSTRDTKRACGCSLREAAMMGLAPDGGLFVPERIPQADMAEVERLAGESYAAMAGYLAGLFFGDDFDPQLLRRELESLYDFPVPLRAVGCGRYTLELFHGPTCAFKDFGAGFMGRAIGLLGAAGERLVILTATSGDTGSAVAHGFYGVPGVDVVVLYPEGKISRLQECQMTALGGNIHPLRVAGTFDDCPRLVKELFADAEFRKRRGFVAASNINDVVPEFLRTGVYRPRPSVRTPANAMDVGAPSNFERMLWLCGGDPEALRGELEGFRCDDACIRRTIDELYERHGYFSDPHSAVGYAASMAVGKPGFYLSTAHPAKFGEVIASVTGARVPLPERLEELTRRPQRSEPLAVDLAALEAYVEKV